MKKVGILTVQRAVNYGAILQMFGLYYTVKKITPNVQIIDYDSLVIKKRENYFRNIFLWDRNRGFFRNIFEICNSIVSLPFLILKKKKFADFLINNTKLTERVDKKTIVTCLEDFDICISGSDQIWNKMLVNDNVYMFGFDGKFKKISYAASFGNTIALYNYWEENAPLLKSYDSISVRENFGIDFIEKRLDKKIEVHVDPALLLSGEEWGELFDLSNTNNEEYIILYWASRRLKNYAIEIAKKNNWKVLDINDGILKGKMKNVRGIGPVEFMRYIKNSQMVCTTSFHGLVFSLLFHKNFMVDYFEDGDNKNYRQHELLLKLNLTNRNINVEADKTEIDWSSVDYLLDIERARSFKYLNENIRGF